MKSNRILLATVILLSGITFSCKKISDLNTTLVSVTLEKDLPITGLAQSDSISMVYDIDANSNLDYTSRKSKLLTVTVNKSFYKINLVNSTNLADSINYIRFELFNPQTGNFETIAEDSLKPIQLNLISELTLNQNTLNKLTAIFESENPKATIRFQGRTKNSPVSINASLAMQLSLKTKL